MKRDCWNKNTNRIKTALLTITDLTNNLEPARNIKKLKIEYRSHGVKV